ncbi:YiiX/YebB-like N1pC/P60 family cysteine hydrolase [Coraliomargarita sp. SDUM461004]|uniref:YiiX/YebB-like N1pC/P60 family cysteine hydrolase n=1 Tax=Thalassobacterium sedimentorum TaxID=3041258 RepID=A0ABU1ALC5_9BACT|nr:YiiX/YebB-like N1pC/P60 family cysteine hydrolase [Coraliomargarita sp. SDUM461004]MDQ8195596.1 YiiX/YebB-like N1pC/P60 family cysteine hydrolase [Coraliomargarita sp. SDUM461004]
MRYPNIQTGDLLLCSGSGWFSKMIQAATRSRWSHVALVLRLDAFDRIMLLESVEPIGVRTVPLNQYLTNYDQQGHAYPGHMQIMRHRDFARQVAPDALATLGRFAVDRFGYPYDSQQIAEIAARITLNRMAPEMLDSLPSWPSEHQEAYICSEYVAACYRQVGLSVEGEHFGFVTPADFAEHPAIEWVQNLPTR